MDYINEELDYINEESLSGFTNAEEFFRKHMELKRELLQKIGELEAKDALIHQMKAEIQNLKYHSEISQEKCRTLTIESNNYRDKYDYVIELFKGAKEKHDRIVSQLSQRIEAVKAETLAEQNAIKDDEIMKLKLTIKNREFQFYNQIRDKCHEILQQRTIIKELEQGLGYYQNLLGLAQTNLEFANHQHQFTMKAYDNVIYKLQKSIAYLQDSGLGNKPPTALSTASLANPYGTMERNSSTAQQEK